MDHSFHINEPKSVMVIGAENPDMTVFCLHDSGGNAATMYGMRHMLVREFPTAQIVSMNGVRPAKS